MKTIIMLVIALALVSIAQATPALETAARNLVAAEQEQQTVTMSHLRKLAAATEAAANRASKKMEPVVTAAKAEAEKTGKVIEAKAPEVLGSMTEMKKAQTGMISSFLSTATAAVESLGK